MFISRSVSSPIRLAAFHPAYFGPNAQTFKGITIGNKGTFFIHWVGEEIECKGFAGLSVHPFEIPDHTSGLLKQRISLHKDVPVSASGEICRQPDFVGEDTLRYLVPKRLPTTVTYNLTFCVDFRILAFCGRTIHDSR